MNFRRTFLKVLKFRLVIKNVYVGIYLFVMFSKQYKKIVIGCENQCLKYHILTSLGTKLSTFLIYSAEITFKRK